MIPAAMLSILSTAFSCSYGDDEDDKKDDAKKIEVLAPSLVLGLQAAQQQPAEKAKE